MANTGSIGYAAQQVDSIPFNLGFQTKHILNPWSMHFNPMKVSFSGFEILSKIHSVRCDVQLKAFSILFKSFSASVYHKNEGTLMWTMI